ncbi:MAG: hypothetical protein SFV21_17395 [Rhodospirillaceae bacterium]|nr:hypothetical protein [Rhodospirillaceae bacterium]
MKATIDIPDELYRRVKAKSALEGRAIRAVAIELLAGWADTPATPPPRAKIKFVPGDEAARKALMGFCGVVESGIPDLATNPKYMEGFGED